MISTFLLRMCLMVLARMGIFMTMCSLNTSPTDFSGGTFLAPLPLISYSQHVPFDGFRHTELAHSVLLTDNSGQWPYLDMQSNGIQSTVDEKRPRQWSEYHATRRLSYLDDILKTKVNSQQRPTILGNSSKSIFQSSFKLPISFQQLPALSNMSMFPTPPSSSGRPSPVGRSPPSGSQALLTVVLTRMCLDEPDVLTVLLQLLREKLNIRCINEFTSCLATADRPLDRVRDYLADICEAYRIPVPEHVLDAVVNGLRWFHQDGHVSYEDIPARWRSYTYNKGLEASYAAANTPKPPATTPH